MAKLYSPVETSFQKKIELFSHDYLECCFYIANEPNKQKLSKQSLYSKLISTSQTLNDFLNYHHATSNAHWQVYATMCSMIKYLAVGAYWQKHSERCKSTNTIYKKKISKKTEKVSDFFNTSLVEIATHIISETKSLKIPLVKKNLTDKDFPTINTSDILECNVTLESGKTKKQDIVKIANDFLFLTSDFKKLIFPSKGNLKQLEILIPEKINVSIIKHFKVLIDNLRIFSNICTSETEIIFAKEEVKKLNNYLHLIFYLLQTTISLLQFYEQYMRILSTNSTISKKNIHKLSTLISFNHSLNWVIDFELNNSCLLINLGENLARKIITQNIEISSIKVKVPTKFGFHTRPSLLVAKIVQNYGSKVCLEIGEDKFDASSVLNIQWAGGKIQKEKISEIVFSGDTRTLRDIKLLASINYGEDTMGKKIKLPSELSYLR